jgi:hypothetical protein
MQDTATRAPRAPSQRHQARPRRTVEIRGHGSAPPPIPRARELQVAPAPRPQRSGVVRVRTGARPDRVALWAFLLAVFTVLVAAASSHAAVIG